STTQASSALDTVGAAAPSKFPAEDAPVRHNHQGGITGRSPWLEAKRAPRIADSMCTVFLFLRRRMERWSRVCQELGRVRKIPIGSNEATTSKNFSVIA